MRQVNIVNKVFGGVFIPRMDLHLKDKEEGVVCKTDVNILMQVLGSLASSLDVFMFEAKTTLAFDYDSLKNALDKAMNLREESKEKDLGDNIRCGVTQVILLISKCRIGALSTAETTWFVRVEKRGKEYGLLATPGFRLHPDRQNIPQGLSLAQALLIAVLESKKLMDDEREFDWKQIHGKLKKAFGRRVGNDSMLDGVVSTGKPESKRKSSTRNSRRKSKTDESQDLPLASVSFTHDLADENVLFILGRTGLGCSKQRVQGYLCFIKTISPEHAGSEPVEELMHEAEIYMFLQIFVGSRSADCRIIWQTGRWQVCSYHD